MEDLFTSCLSLSTIVSLKIRQFMATEAIFVQVIGVRTSHIARKVKKNHFFVSEKKSLKLIKISDFLLPI